MLVQAEYTLVQAEYTLVQAERYAPTSNIEKLVNRIEQSVLSRRKREKEAVFPSKNSSRVLPTCEIPYLNDTHALKLQGSLQMHNNHICFVFHLRDDTPTIKLLHRQIPQRETDCHANYGDEHLEKQSLTTKTPLGKCAKKANKEKKASLNRAQLHNAMLRTERNAFLKKSPCKQGETVASDDLPK
ncbi:hypothetical protein POVCU1_001170 [Plasmodium ovale curtisi]|uniref:Uncharacterized protein n=1 Tax=Plasmodium ovale curtisi TaxID=864141 RepID=A0A1A8VLG0_PLAOA|nr:hypothetical protein POVCU1_001170 [Plasmodium ovale curtisi]